MIRGLRRYTPPPIKAPPSQMTQAFKALRKLGYFARQNFWCCNNCALYAMPEGTQKYIFFSKQGGESLINKGYVYVAWGGDAAEIIRVLQEHGLFVYWGGTDAHCIRISYKDLPPPEEPKQDDSLAPALGGT